MSRCVNFEPPIKVLTMTCALFRPSLSFELRSLPFRDHDTTVTPRNTARAIERVVASYLTSTLARNILNTLAATVEQACASTSASERIASRCLVSEANNLWSWGAQEELEDHYPEFQWVRVFILVLACFRWHSDAHLRPCSFIAICRSPALLSAVRDPDITQAIS